MTYLIGGPARVGKSTLFRKLAPLVSGQALSIDTLKPSIHHFARPLPQDPLLAAPSEDDNTPESWLAELRVRDRIIWDGLTPYLREADADGWDVLIEGGLWPDYVAEMHDVVPHRAVWLIDTTETQQRADRLINIARTTSARNNWQANWSEDRLRRWAQFDRHRSEEIRRLADGAGRRDLRISQPYQCVDIAHFDSMRLAQQTAARLLGFTFSDVTPERPARRAIGDAYASSDLLLDATWDGAVSR
jgi:hypothetical protein